MLNEIINNIILRRSCRSFLNKPILKDELDQILLAGTYAPSGRGAQSPVIVAITNPDERNIVSKLNAQILNSHNDPYYGAPYIILVLADSNINTYIEDGSCALENMMLAATSLGIGSCWIHREREMFETEQGKQLLKKWGLSESLKGIGSLAIGYPKELKTEAKPRKSDYIKII